jgi:hypothetical protein
MKAVELRRRFLDEELGRFPRGEAEAAFRSILDRLIMERLLPFTRNQRDVIARRAARLMGQAGQVPPSLRADMAKGAWRARAAAASSLSRGGRALRAAGSLAADDAEDAKKPRPTFDADAARALATAIREVGTPGVVEAQARVTGDAAAALRHEDGGAHVWEKALAPLLREFAWNAESAGATRQEAALEALAAAAALTGRARHPEGDALPFLLGAASRGLLRQEKALAPETAAIRRLAEDLSARNEVRQRIWDGLDSMETRLLGAAVACAVFGKGTLRPRAPAAASAFDGTMLPEDWRERFASLTAAEAAEELGRLASDPRLDADARATAEFAAEAALAHPGARRVSFAEALGLADPEIRAARMRPGRLFRAAPRRGHAAQVLCRGKNGRLIRCRAVADADGALVGYLAFDPLSREYGGRPLFAAYALDGKRQGYAWADEPAHWRAGRPEQGFVSAPESIPV